MAVVCDGHGGDRYFRSDRGSRLCCEVTAKAVREFARKAPDDLFAGASLTQRGPLSTLDPADKLRRQDIMLRQLFASIIARWSEAILADAQASPLSDDERSQLKPEWQEAFEQGLDLEKVYGTTLMAYVQTRSYWLAFHIGDGKLVAYDGKEWSEPVPWDDRCFLNKTTSICDVDAIDKVRYCYCGDGSFPVAVFLGSDGIDDSFGPMDNLIDFYRQVAKAIVMEGPIKTRNTLANLLPQLSKRGSQDDMSVAYVYDEERLPALIPAIIRQQIERQEAAIASLRSTIEAEQAKAESLSEATSQRDTIERDYALKKAETLQLKMEAEEQRLANLQAELQSLPAPSQSEP